MNTINGTITTNETAEHEISQHIGQEILLHGSVYKIRKMSGFAFVLLRTRKSIIQCIYTPEKTILTSEQLKEESCVKIKAFVKPDIRSKTGWELELLEINVLSEPNEEMPVVINQKQIDASLEHILNYRPLALRNEKERAIFKIQEGIVRSFRDFLTSQEFTEIHTPKIVSAGAEGGANIFELNYFQKKAFLAQSPQFYKQMMVGVYERVFEIGPVFRAEKHDTSRHLNEYTSVDFEMGYINSFEDLMQTETKMLQYTMQHLQAEYFHELELLQVNVPQIKAIPVIRFIEAKHLIAQKYNRVIKDFYDFEPEEETLLCEIMKKDAGSDFVFVTHYPSAKRPFYAKDDPENPEETLSFDLLFRGLEITTGGQRIHSYQEQIQKLENKGLNKDDFESFLMMHKHGMPPHGGLGLGLERFTSRLLGYENVRRTTLFPRDINRLSP